MDDTKRLGVGGPASAPWELIERAPTTRLRAGGSTRRLTAPLTAPVVTTGPMTPPPACPRCGANRLRPAGVVTGMVAPNLWQCLGCLRWWRAEQLARPVDTRSPGPAHAGSVPTRPLR
jgi:hypothetical protein